MKNIKIQNSYIGENQPCFLIAEIAQAHDGSLGFAHAFIDAAADAGADAIKFQTHYADHESTKNEKFRINFSYEDKTRYDYWKRMEFTKSEWIQLSNHCKKRNIIFLSSAFSIEAVNILQEIGMPAWKVGSGEIFSKDLLKVMASTKKPILLSTGMANWDEINEVVNILGNNEILLFQTTSKYPTPLSEVGLNNLDELKCFDFPVGLSDHSGTVFPSITAISRGISALELHVTFHKKSFGPDTKASITFEEFEFIKKTRDAVFLMDNSKVDKNEMALNLNKMRSSFSKSAAPKMHLKKGQIISKNMVTFKKPGTGIKSNEIKKIIGKVLKKDILPNELFSYEHFHD